MGILSLLTFAFAPVVKDCGSPTTLFKINAVSLSPIDPVPGHNVTLHLDYTVPNGLVVTDGQASYTVVYNFMPMTPTIEPLCKNIPCPLSAGTYSNDTTSLWPSGISGTLTTTIRWSNQDSKPLLCIRIDARL